MGNQMLRVQIVKKKLFSISNSIFLWFQPNPIKFTIRRQMSSHLVVIQVASADVVQIDEK